MSIGALVFMLAAFAMGMALSVQPALNAMLARAIGSPYGAAMISIAVSFSLAVVILTFAGWGRAMPQTVPAVPWWVYFGGVIGAVFVFAGIAIAPAIGALLFFVCVIAGQLAGAAMADHFGAFGLAVREFSPGRILGLALVIAGAIVVQRT